MHKALSNKPTFDPERFLWQLREWKALPAGPGQDRVVVEWCVTYGPKVYVYPAVQRAVGFDLCAGAGDGTSDERWADFLEFEYVPQVVAALEKGGFNPHVICADQRPIQTMRAQRRAHQPHH